jgi:hypothetical protein
MTEVKTNMRIWNKANDLLASLSWTDGTADTELVAKALAEAEHSALAAAQGEALSGDELVKVLTLALRTGDQAYESTGGSTRHYVRECLLPVLERMRLTVVRLPPIADPEASK